MSHSNGGDRLKSSGRGALSNRSGRFESHSHEDFDDGWSSSKRDEQALRDPGELDDEQTWNELSGRNPTRVQPERSKRIISANDSPDIPFDRSINPYKGCEHGCIYCFARPTHTYLGLSAGLDFETRIFSKPDAARLLRKELAAKSWQPQTIALGANTDPYQPAERSLGITREILEVLDEAHNPVSVVTKSSLVLRDIDLLASMAARRQASVFISITTLDADLARRMEPRAAAPHRRLEVVAALSQAGIPCGVLASPMIPALNDAELESILEAAHEHGATSANYLLLRLPLELKELFEQWLRAHYPRRADHVLSLVRSAHDGGLYRSEFGTRMRGDGAYVQILERRFETALVRIGLARRMVDHDASPFRRPAKDDERRQLALF